jgi:hypothetical protein
MGATGNEAMNHTNENWDTIRYNSLDGQGAGWYSYKGSCNFDCNYWTFGI